LLLCRNRLDQRNLNLDETTTLTFLYLLEKHGLGEQIFETVNAQLSSRGMSIRLGTITDDTLTVAPSSTKS